MGLHVWGVGGGRCEQVEAANCDIPPFSPPHLDERQARALHRLSGSVYAVDGHHHPAVSAHHLQGGGTLWMCAPPAGGIGGSFNTETAQGGLHSPRDGGAKGRLYTHALAPPPWTLLRPPPTGILPPPPSHLEHVLCSGGCLDGVNLVRAAAGHGTVLGIEGMAFAQENLKGGDFD